MTAPAIAPSVRRSDPHAAERVRRWRERQRAQDRAQRRRVADDIGPAIREGEPITDNLDRCDAKWVRLLGGQRYADAVIRCAPGQAYQPVSDVVGLEIARA